MLKIAYDISILGQGHANPKARTGIYRMVESLLLELLKIQQISFDLIALNKDSSYWDHLAVEIYLKSLDNTISISSPYPSNFLIKTLYKQLVNQHRSILQSNAGTNSFIYKTAQGIKIISEILDQSLIKPNLSSLEYSLYHSTYFSLPILPNKIQRILTIYDLIPQFFPEFVTPKVLQRGIKILDSIDIKKDWIICISEHTKQDFCNYTNMNPERVFVTPLAASNNFYPVTDSDTINQKLAQYQIPPKPYFLSLCTLEPRKNLSFLLRCFANLLAQDPTLDLNLVLVGVSGWKNNDIFQTVQNNPTLKSHVIFTGYIPDQDLSAIYSGALGFVYPSLYEGFGLPPLEAMQCGTPVITSNTSSLPEVIGDAGIMINPTDSDELCQAMLDLINSADLRNQLSQKGRDRAQQFSWSKCAQETVEIYKTIT
ncbi:MAG: glycosyltransferase family 1 protein [Snowella sp.]|nr:MAG: glycosyltransferase family 1 protein [Snowella sp.]